MAVQQIINITADLNDNSIAVLDVGGFDYAMVQIVTPTGAITFATSLDAGAVTGSSDGSAASAINFIDVQGTNINSGSAVTSLNASGIVKITNIGQFLRVSGAGATVAKAFVRLYKIN